MSDPLQFEKVSIEDAKRALQENPGVGSPRKAEDEDWRWARTYTAPVPLKESTVAWLHHLPSHVRPAELATAYPRIANRLCDLWKHPDECEQYFQDLAHGRRGRRTGFPGNIPNEIAALSTYYFHPGQDHSLWDRSNVYRR